MPKSMTGFGRGQCIKYDRRFKVEIKAVNHRYNDITIKLPRFLNSFEDRIKKRLSKDISRGKVDVWINFESFTKKDVAVNINEAFADAYMDAMSTLAARYNLGGNVPMQPGLELLARNPDIITFDKFDAAVSATDTQAEMWETLEEALESALGQFNEMRKAEGDALSRDINTKGQRMKVLITQIAARAPIVVEEHAAKLRERVTEMIANLGHQLDEGRFLTEIALLADRSTIDEELTRLDSHLSQLATMLNETNAIGRKLDFLVQEMNREANTIGSKSADVELSRLVVELKSEVEKIREQVQNIE
ncbi:MAG: YicC family protein [Defluviitaleaceae bacterium]|nr:YicC family protein [Defluviitaleaceae bacterium]